MSFCYEYPRPALGTDLLLFCKEGKNMLLLLIERKNDPFRGAWAFPGGFVEEGESCEQAAQRELMEETGIKLSTIAQLGAFSRPGRDPRGWVVTVAYWAIVKREDVAPIAGDDAENVQWHNINMLPPLAFDHQEILNKALDLPQIRSLNS